jgi:hypothetical protein
MGDDRGRVALAGINLLRRLIELIAALPDGGGPVGAQFAGLVAADEAGAAAGTRLDECLGLVPPAGQIAWFTIERRRQGASLIVELDAAIFAADSRPGPYTRAEATKMPPQSRAETAERVRRPKGKPTRVRGQRASARKRAPSA